MLVMFKCGVIVCLTLLAGSGAALAHDPVFSTDPQERAAAGLSAVILGLLWLIYVIGARRRKPLRRLAALFHFTFLICVVTVFGPLDERAETNEAAHMSQHMLFMVVIAPLLVLARPLPQLVAGGGRFGLWLWRPVLRLTRYPLICAYIHGAVIWFWHVPYFYNLALENPWWHSAEHGFFLASAGLFWWAVLQGGRQRAPWALLALLVTLMHTGFLGALLTFAPEPLYGQGRDVSDQQLAGLIMWVAGAVPYLIAAGWVSYRWYLQLQQRMSPG